MQQITDARIEAKRPPLLRLAFRPFFLLGAAFATLAIIRWVLILNGEISWQAYLPAILWHAHEMLFGFVLAIVIGFLLTAVQTWTGIPGLRGLPLGILVLCWLLARVVFWISPNISWLVYWLPDILLITSASFFLARPIIVRRQWKNLPFIPILLAFAFLHSGFIYGLATEMPAFANACLMATFWLVLLLISVMGARVIPFFTARRWQVEQYREPQWLGICLPLGFLVIIGTQFLSPSASATASTGILRTGTEFFLASGLSWRLYHWQHKNNWQEPLLWSLHISYGALALGLLLMALSPLNTPLNTQALHLIAIVGIAGIILAMIARVSLGHTGQALKLAGTMSWAFGVLIAGGLLRFFGPLFAAEFTAQAYLIAGLLFSTSFGLFLWHYGALLSKARSDGRPG